MTVLGPVTLYLFALSWVSPQPGPGAQDEDAAPAAAPLTSVSGAVDAACLWLLQSQEDDGSWRPSGSLQVQDGDTKEGGDDDQFWARALGESLPKTEAGETVHAVGVSALALYGLMADPHPGGTGGYGEALGRGLDWLLSKQDTATGRIGAAEGFGFHYGHAMATLALARALVDGHVDPGKEEAYGEALEDAVRYIEAARNPYGAWRYDFPPVGESDTSISAWMTLALTEARAAGCTVSDEALGGADQWFLQMTDPESGRVGYTERGSVSSRVPGFNDAAPHEGAETLTAGALLARIRMGTKARSDATMVAHVKLALGAWDLAPSERLQDAIWIFWGTAAMAEVGSLPWEKWSPRVRSLLLGTQVREDARRGSWDPNGAWGYALGRVGTTALCAASLAAVERAGESLGNDSPPTPVAARRKVDGSVRLGLAWLADHQEADGHWSAQRFMDHDPEGDRTDGAGDRQHDVGVTGLAILAFLGDGKTHLKGEHHGVLGRGLDWLEGQQDPDTGAFLESAGSHLYDHAIASLAMTEAYALTADAALRDPAQRAVHYIARARNPYGVWRYSVPPDGDNDTSVTAWMIQALRSAADAGLSVDSESFEAATAWVNELTDPATGRVGYTERGSWSSRVPGMNDTHRTDAYEALTAAGLYTLFLAGEGPTSVGPERVAGGAAPRSFVQRADLVAETVDVLRDPTIPRDLYAIYYGSLAMFAMGGSYRDRWAEALREVVLDSQRQDGAARGSYDPTGPWGYSGGRVYATSMMLLSALAVKRWDQLTR